MKKLLTKFKPMKLKLARRSLPMNQKFSAQLQTLMAK
jgi:hypothetical protein